MIRQQIFMVEKLVEIGIFLNKLTLTFNSSIRMNDIKLYKTDKSDNDDDGEVDESGENWTINSSGFNLTLGYRF